MAISILLVLLLELVLDPSTPLPDRFPFLPRLLIENEEEDEFE